MVIDSNKRIEACDYRLVIDCSIAIDNDSLIVIDCYRSIDWISDDRLSSIDHAGKESECNLSVKCLLALL